MKCPKCNTEIFGKHETCPLCGYVLSGSAESGTPDNIKRTLESSESRVKEILSARASKSTDVSVDLMHSDYFADYSHEKQTVDTITDINSDVEFKVAKPSDFGFDTPEVFPSKADGVNYDETDGQESVSDKFKSLLSGVNIKKFGFGGSREIEPNDNELININKRAASIREANAASSPERFTERKVKREKKMLSGNSVVDFASLIKGACGVAALVILFFISAILIRGCSSSVTEKSVELPVVYMKENSIVSRYDGTSTVLTENTVNENTYPAAQEGESPIVYNKLSIALEGGLVKISEDGKYIYFLDNYDVVNKYGTLNVIDSKGGKKSVIAEEVSDSFVISPGGKKVLYLVGADSTGNMGTLYSYALGDKESLKINDDMDRDTFVFAQDQENVLFIQNFDTSSYSGDLYIKNIKKRKSEKRKIDSEVYSVFGSDRTGKVFVYAKEYNASSKVYDVYIKSENSEKKRVVEQAKSAPVITCSMDMMYVFGVLENGSQSLYATNTQTGEKEKIASGVSGILKVSADEKTIIFNKVYENNMADYYLYNLSGEQYKIASNVHTLGNTDFSGLQQFDISADLTRVAYISSFDTQRGCGALYSISFNGGKTADSVKITDDAYACSISDNGKLIYYASNYNAEQQNVNIYTYKNDKNSKNSESGLLVGEVNAKKFDFSNDGESVLYQTGVNELGVGPLSIISSDAKSSVLSDGVYTFYERENGDILLVKDVKNNENDKSSAFNVYITNKKGSKNETLDTDISGFIKL